MGRQPDRDLNQLRLIGRELETFSLEGKGCCQKAGALVAIDERMVLHDRVHQGGCPGERRGEQLAVTKASSGPRHRGAQGTGIPQAAQTAKLLGCHAVQE